jgi:hypothetical protein
MRTRAQGVGATTAPRLRRVGWPWLQATGRDRPAIELADTVVLAVPLDLAPASGPSAALGMAWHPLTGQDAPAAPLLAASQLGPRRRLRVAGGAGGLAGCGLLLAA